MNRSDVRSRRVGAFAVLLASALSGCPEPTGGDSVDGSTTVDARSVSDGPAASGGTGGGGSGGGTGGGGSGGGGTGGGGAGGGGSGGGGMAGGAGTGGMGGTGGSRDAGADRVGATDTRPPVEAGTDAAAAPTFTELYNTYFSKVASPTVVGCKAANGACHEASHEGFICSTKQNCYDSMKIRAEPPETPEEAIIYIILDAKTMPKGSNKKFGATELARIKSWIANGAKND